MRRFSLSLVFLCDSKILQRKAEEIKCAVGYDFYFAISSVGSKEGLILLWKRKIMVNIRSFLEGHVDAVIGLGMAS